MEELLEELEEEELLLELLELEDELLILDELDELLLLLDDEELDELREEELELLLKDELLDEDDEEREEEEELLELATVARISNPITPQGSFAVDIVPPETVPGLFVGVQVCNPIPVSGVVAL